ncbi:MAG: hypothetical protein ACD_79C00182G0014 [uncultured bacterium]|nr:MAG: hypothetical protein ACD_79C00182G0014 [uncultured bacterium]
MLKTATVRARIEPSLKKKAEFIFKKFGLNSSKAITLFFHRVCLDKGLPFELKIPNAETLKAINIRNKYFGE